MALGLTASPLVIPQIHRFSDRVTGRKIDGDLGVEDMQLGYVNDLYI